METVSVVGDSTIFPARSNPMVTDTPIEAGTGADTETVQPVRCQRWANRGWNDRFSGRPEGDSTVIASALADLVSTLTTGFETFISALSDLIETFSERISLLGPPRTAPGTEPPSTVPSTGQPAPSTFSEIARSVVVADKDGEISEAQLLFATVYYQLRNAQPESAEEFKKLYTNYRQSGLFIDTSVKKALGELVEGNKLTKANADLFYSRAFRAAQLDGDLESLAGRGGGTRLRTGEAKLDAALETAESNLSKIESGTILASTVG